jgi:hypothetical protein
MPFFDPLEAGFYSDDREDIPAGAIEISEELRDSLISAGLPIVLDQHGQPVVVQPDQPTAAVLLEQLLAILDKAADDARVLIIGDPLRALEYEAAAAEAQQFKDAGYPADAIPRAVAAGAIHGITAQESADSILREAAQFSDAQYRIRETRLLAKATVRDLASAGQFDYARQVVDEAVALINQTVSEVGNVAD